MSLVGQHSAGPWLRKIVVVDSAIVASHENTASDRVASNLLNLVFLHVVVVRWGIGEWIMLALGRFILTDGICFCQTGAVTTCSLVERLAE